MATKIETDLTPEQLLEFFRRLAQTKGGITGPAIKALCEEFGVTISHETANEYRKGIVRRELERLRRNAEKSKEIIDAVKADVPISEANAVRLQLALSDKLDDLDPEEVSVKELGMLVLANARIRQGDQRAKKLESDLRLRDEQIGRLERQRGEWEQKQREIREQLERARKSKGSSADEVRAAAVAEIDRIMGIS